MFLVVFDNLGRVLRQTSPDRGRRWGVRKGEQGRARIWIVACGGKAVAGELVI